MSCTKFTSSRGSSWRQNVILQNLDGTAYTGDLSGYTCEMEWRGLSGSLVARLETATRPPSAPGSAPPLEDGSIVIDNVGKQFQIELHLSKCSTIPEGIYRVAIRAWTAAGDDFFLVETTVAQATTCLGGS